MQAFEGGIFWLVVTYQVSPQKTHILYVLIKSLFSRGTSTKCSTPGDSIRDLFYPPVGGHLTFEGVT